jgi:geranylgeranyl pyrophosphate synthase
VASINKLYGNKMAVLAGDFLLARASVRYTAHQILYCGVRVVWSVVLLVGWRELKKAL